MPRVTNSSSTDGPGGKRQEKGSSEWTRKQEKGQQRHAGILMVLVNKSASISERDRYWQEYMQGILWVIISE